MEVPNWVWDELRPRTAGTTGLMVALAILRHGEAAQAGGSTAGGTRLKATVQTLASMAGVSKRAVELAEVAMAGMGYLEVTKPPRPREPRVYILTARETPGRRADRGDVALQEREEVSHAGDQARERRADFSREEGVDGERRADFSRLPDSSRARANGGGRGDGGGGDDPDHLRSDSRNGSITTSNIDPVLGEQIFRALRAIGVDSISALVAKHGMKNIHGALCVLHRKMVGEDVGNPPGLLVSLLGTLGEFDEPEGEGAFLADLADPDRMAARRRMARYGGAQRNGAGDGGEGAGARWE